MFGRLSLFLIAISATVIWTQVLGDITGRIVGGNEATITQFPYQISLRNSHRHTCGGSIITSRHILTAAHCVWGPDNQAYPAELYSILAGTSNRVAGGVLVQVKKITVHEGYTGAGILNDVAVLELDNDLVWTDKIKPIEMESNEVPEGSQVVISGWGLREANGESSPIFMFYTYVTALSKKQCLSKMLISEDSLICLDHDKGTGACNGDSGGPAVCNGKLVGIAGFVVLKCGSSRPDGYAKVAYHLEWIKSKLN